jgi:thiamine-phosphate pyrophosphorylase
VTDPRPDLVGRVEAAVRGGVNIVQFRDKDAPGEGRIPLAEKLKDVCDRAGVLFTVNDDLELARLVGAGGVHLGQDDAPTSRAREVLGPGAIVGRSAGSVGEAWEAVREGADYLGVGAVYATPTKPEGGVAGIELIRALSREGLPVPWFAIGGVTVQTAPAVAAAGAPGFAIVRAVLDAEDPEKAARELRALL